MQSINKIGLWDQIAAVLKHSECGEISSLINNKILDDNKSLWNQVYAILEILLEIEGSGIVATQSNKIKEHMINQGYQIFASELSRSENVYLKPTFRKMCERIEELMQAENVYLCEKVIEMERSLYEEVEVISSPKKPKLKSKPESDLTLTSLSLEDQCGRCKHKLCTCRSTPQESRKDKSSLPVGRLRREDKPIVEHHRHEALLVENVAALCISGQRNDVSNAGASTVKVEEGSGVNDSNRTQSKLRNKLQSARDEKHFLDDSELF